jgi:hypothetical protein
MPIKQTLGLILAVVSLGWQTPAFAQIVPGTGQQLTEVFDDFEDPNWSFVLNLPKASTNIDKVDRQPAGYSTNQMWFESTYRGTPDFVKRVETPEGGLPGSTGALALQTLYSGIPGQLSHKFQQDDLIANVSQKIGFMIPATWSPSYVVRVYVPPFEQWEQRIGSSFGYRADCQTIIDKPTRLGKLLRTRGTSKEIEQYWPGFFIQFNGKNHPQYPKQDTATILIRSGERGEDIPGPVITRPGWWTLGMTITPDGKVHYYGHEGIANLTARDHLYSNFPYGYKCLQTSTYFFNIVNQDDGRTWSTRWIVDDPKVFVATRPYSPQQTPQTAGVPAKPISQTTPVPAAQPAAPAVQPAPSAPVTPVTPAKPTTVEAPIPAVPAASSAPESASSAKTLPPLQTSPVKIPVNEPAESAPRVNTSTSLLPSSIPSLSTSPQPITPTRASGPAVPEAAPALLPMDILNPGGLVAAPVIAAPSPAPLASPQEDDGPALSTPPAPATPESPATKTESFDKK